MLLSQVFKHLGLEETDYFGLQYRDKKDHVVGGWWRGGGKEGCLVAKCSRVVREQRRSDTCYRLFV